MLLGALVDAGADLGQVQSLVDAVVPATVRLDAGSVTRAGLRALKVDVQVLAPDQPHRPWSQVRRLLAEAALPQPVRDRSLGVFELLAEAEARVHGVALDDVHFHEVGAWDSIADIVGVCAAIHLLGVQTVSAGPVSLGSGRTRTAHGDVPVPAPATLQLAAGWSVRAGGDGELATPTGMALVRGLTSTCEDLPALRVAAVGVGAGTRDTPDRANVVRVVTGLPESSSAASAGPAGEQTERMWVLQANVDDLDPRVWPDVLATLLEAGAADAWLTPILMKKGRPAHTLSVLSDGSGRVRLRDLVLTATTTFGVREHPVDRVALARTWRTVDVEGHPVRIKVSTGADGLVRHATPELEDVASVARALGLPLRRMLAASEAAASAAGLAPGARLD